MWLARPGCERIAARRRVLDLIKFAQRRPRFAELDDVAANTDVVDARIRLRAILEESLSQNELTALGRAVRGEPITRSEKALAQALWRLRRRLAT